MVLRLVAVLLVGVCLVPACAVAGRYHDFLCRIPYGPEAGRAAPTADVSYATLNGPYLSAGDGCEGGGALHGRVLSRHAG